MIIVVELILLCALFFGICYMNTGSDQKNIKSFSSYPDLIQESVRNNPQLASKIKTASPAASFISNVVLFGIILFILGLPVRSPDFIRNFVTLSILGQGLNAFDFLVIDMLWWRNSKRVRFSGTENMPQLYKSPKKHFESFLRGIAAFLVVAVLDGALLMLF